MLEPFSIAPHSKLDHCSEAEGAVRTQARNPTECQTIKRGGMTALKHRPFNFHEAWLEEVYSDAGRFIPAISHLGFWHSGIARNSLLFHGFRALRVD
eukprot:6012716-Amphidinium_carterae.1